jgi:HlyD family secretion protein
MKSFRESRVDYRMRALIAFVSVVMLADFLGCRKSVEVDSFSERATAIAELPKVTTAKPVRQVLLQKTEQPGRVEAFSTTHILAKVSGYIDQQLVDIGDRVVGPKRDSQGNVTEAGQILAVLTAPELQDERMQKEAMIVQATSDIAQAEAAVEVAKSAAMSAEAIIDEFVASQQRAESEYQRWKSESERIHVLASTQTVTQKLADETLQQMLAADATRSESAAKIRSAKAKQNEALMGVTKAIADLNAAKARLKIAEAELKRVRSLCDYLVIRAPYDGFITERNYDLGALIQAARSSEEKPLFTIVQTDKIRVFIDVPETDAALVESGRKAVIKVPSLGGRVYEGNVTRTAWALQSGSRTLRSEIDIPNETGVLRPGMYANVELTVAEKQDALSLPKAAVVMLDGQSYCMVVTDSGKVTKTAIKVGIRSANEVEIASGLAGGENVIIANAAAFQDGQFVQMASK